MLDGYVLINLNVRIICVIISNNPANVWISKNASWHTSAAANKNLYPVEAFGYILSENKSDKLKDRLMKRLLGLNKKSILQWNFEYSFLQQKQ